MLKHEAGGSGSLIRRPSTPFCSTPNQGMAAEPISTRTSPLPCGTRGPSCPLPRPTRGWTNPPSSASITGFAVIRRSASGPCAP
jgi:hypothetical protein